MWRRLVVAGSVVIVIVAVVMVILAAGSPSGLNGALGIWGFVLAALGVMLAAVALWPARSVKDRLGVQVNSAEHGDMFVSQYGDVQANSSRRATRGTDR